MSAAAETMRLSAPSAAEGRSGDAGCAALARAGEGGTLALHLMVEGAHCGGCVRRIERALAAEPDVASARLNLTTRRLTVTWAGEPARADALAGVVRRLGYGALPFDPERLGAGDRADARELLIALAVAGFAAANIMLLSVSIWAGHYQDMTPETRALLHWFSALIGLPAVAWAGRPFFRSAVAALVDLRTNMDVPISVGVVLATAMSLFETVRGGPHVYFDSAVTLLFFLLLGRWLDLRARGRARETAERLLSLGLRPVTVLGPDGTTRPMRPEAVERGMTVLVAPGERIGVDGSVLEGEGAVDCSLITGETEPATVRPGERVFAGTLNLGAPLRVGVAATGDGTLLAEIVRLMEAAEQRRSRHVALADRAARWYAPMVHGLALAAFVGWVALGGLAWQQALMIAVAVLIITCPCALGLAVPAVQVVASGRLMRRGILVKSGTALERLAEIDTIVFDKTGTLTEGRPRLRDPGAHDPALLREAGALAANSTHPLARALAQAAGDPAPARDVREVPGEGLARRTAAGEVRLGSRRFAGVEHDAVERTGGDRASELWLTRPDAAPVRFAFEDRPRADAAEVVAAARAMGLAVVLLSGDRPGPVEAVARAAGIADWHAGRTPADKVAALERMRAEGRRPLMVGDGLNDAPALAAAWASLSPTTAADISQTAADAVFQGARLMPVIETLDVAKRSLALVRQNLTMSIAYNLIAVPLALAGLVTPWIAALAMSSSSVAVVLNALRLGLDRRTRGAAP